MERLGRRGDGVDDIFTPPPGKCIIPPAIRATIIAAMTPPKIGSNIVGLLNRDFLFCIGSVDEDGGCGERGVESFFIIVGWPIVDVTSFIGINVGGDDFDFSSEAGLFIISGCCGDDTADVDNGGDMGFELAASSDFAVDVTNSWSSLTERFNCSSFVRI